MPLSLKIGFLTQKMNLRDSDYYEKKMVQKPVWNHAMRVNHQNSARLTPPHSKKHVVLTAVLTRSRLVPLNATRPVTTAVPQTNVKHQRPAKHVVNKPHSPIRRPINHIRAPKNSNFHQKFTTFKTKKVNVVHETKGNWGNPQQALKDKCVIDSGCSRNMTGNISYLSDFEEINREYVAFGGNPKGGKITGKGKIKTGNLDFDDVYFVKELKFNLFSVLQMVPRENNMYNVDLKNIIPSRDLTCLFAKATLYESNYWLKRLGHINFKTMNKLLKGNLVRGLPSKVFENNHRCVACKKGKQHRAFCKSKHVSSVSQPLQRMKGIKREFSFAITPQQNGVVERKNRTLIEAARTMLADLLLPIPFWAEAVNTACYVSNRVLVTKPHNKTPYELLLGRTPSIGFMRPFGCPITILNTLDPLGKFDKKADEGFLWSGPKWLFDIDTLTQSINYQPVVTGNQPNHTICIQENLNADVDVAFDAKENESEVHVSLSSSDKKKKHDEKAKREAKGKSPVDLSNLIPTTRVHKDHPITQIIGDLSSAPQTRSMKRMVKEQDGKLASIPIDTKKPLLKDPDVKWIFRYLKGKPYLGFWYPKDSPFNLVAYPDSDYTVASLDRKSTTGDVSVKLILLVQKLNTASYYC
uniref:Integrase catalytic domain-containing protein n=1 Tax=Tanacetum cinerariifolium TaxID=118510 RepID=A0A6L2J2H0_TANCI|nr:hypothetical protein [Tanacetum cinerariifolium]